MAKNLIYKRYQNGLFDLIVFQDGRFMVLSNGTLHMRRLMTTDGGVYVCRAETVAGSVVAEATLSVMGKSSK